MGEPDREPTKMAGTAALFESGAAAASASWARCSHRSRHGIGQHVDISLAETHFGGVDRRHATAIAFQFSGRKTVRAASHGGGMPQGIYPCADGYVDFTNAGLRPDRVADMLNHAEWLNDPRYNDPVQRMNPAVIEEWNANFLGWCLERTKREIWAEARRAKVMCGPLFTMEDLFTDDALPRPRLLGEDRTRRNGRGRDARPAVHHAEGRLGVAPARTAPRRAHGGSPRRSRA